VYDDVVDYLVNLGVCNEAISWAEDSNFQTHQEAWDACNRPDWMVWYLCTKGINNQLFAFYLDAFDKLFSLPGNFLVQLVEEVRCVSIHERDIVFRFLDLLTIRGNDNIDRARYYLMQVFSNKNMYEWFEDYGLDQVALCNLLRKYFPFAPK
jgi:hypothetical protein